MNPQLEEWYSSGFMLYLLDSLEELKANSLALRPLAQESEKYAC